VKSQNNNRKKQFSPKTKTTAIDPNFLVYTLALGGNWSLICKKIWHKLCYDCENTISLNSNFSKKWFRKITTAKKLFLERLLNTSNYHKCCSFFSQNWGNLPLGAGVNRRCFSFLQKVVNLRKIETTPIDPKFCRIDPCL
jgi:hypothetical protein